MPKRLVGRRQYKQYEGGYAHQYISRSMVHSSVLDPEKRAWGPDSGGQKTVMWGKHSLNLHVFLKLYLLMTHRDNSY